MGIPRHAHWDLRIIHPVLSHIRAGHQTMEVYPVEVASTRYTISKGGYETNKEPMEYRGPKVTGTVKEIYFIKDYFSETRPL